MCFFVSVRGPKDRVFTGGARQSRQIYCPDNYVKQTDFFLHSKYQIFKKYLSSVKFGFVGETKAFNRRLKNQKSYDFNYT